MAGEAVLQPGSLNIYTNRPARYSKKAPNRATLDDWQKIEVFGPEANIVFPTQVKIADVDGDGDNDLMHGGGFFWDSNIGINRGTITWWENRERPRTVKELVGYAKCFKSRTWAQLHACLEDQKSWERHTVAKDSPFAYHNLDYKDLDGDGIKDIVTGGEQGITKPGSDRRPATRPSCGSRTPA